MPKKFICHHGDGGAGWETQHTGGMITSWGHFSQTYGRFEFRAAFPSLTVRGVQSALWLYPQTQTYGRWPLSGEIDVAEFYSRFPDRAVPTLHYPGDAFDENRTNRRCFVAHPERFHTYLLEWTRTMIRVSFDGVTCLVNTKWSPPLPLAHPQPFDHPFTLNLTQALGLGINSPLDNSIVRTPFPATMTVDYVRVWR
jgi:beta-glucanase (GH16 family)